MDEQMPASGDDGEGNAVGVDGHAASALPSGPPQITNAILSQAVLNAISQMDTKLAFDMMLLNEQMNTVDAENKCLKEENSFLKANLAKQTQEQHEMYHYFHGKLDQHVMLIANLEKEIAVAKQELEQAAIDHDVAMEEAQRDLQADIARANREIETLQHELKQLHVFAQQKQQIEAQTEGLEAQLAATIKQFGEEKLELERKSIFEKDRVKKEMLLRMKETKEELLLRTDDQLNTTTKRTMMENDHYMEELSFQSKETEKLLTRFQAMEEEVKRLRVKTKMLEENEAVMAKKNYYYQKILQKLQKKEEKVAIDAIIKEEKGIMQQQPLEKKGSGQSANLNDGGVNEEEIKRLKEHVDELEAVVRRTNEWVQVFQQEKQYLIAQQDEVIEFLSRTIQDAASEARSRRPDQIAVVTPTGATGKAIPNLTRMANKTTTMDELMAELPPLLPLDELSSEDTQFILQFLLEKMKIYQQRISYLFQPQHSIKHVSASTGRPPFVVENGNHRDVIAKQLGVELPPITSAVQQQPSSSALTNNISSSQMSPLKQKRKMFAQVSTSVAAAMEGAPDFKSTGDGDEPVQLLVEFIRFEQKPDEERNAVAIASEQPQ
uniref:Cilia- and flagella-associated protein 157 n=1 Tax=Globisporangium ultimum (strain ATCC 200006 / CBS 805.95 / DAOM BR144) TaxID=431595 RepID=K3X9E2_GLOUD